jgi:hypothetical protein
MTDEVTEAIIEPPDPPHVVAYRGDDIPVTTLRAGFDWKCLTCGETETGRVDIDAAVAAGKQHTCQPTLFLMPIDPEVVPGAPV